MTEVLRYVLGGLRRRRAETVAAVAIVAIAVAYVASLGSFLSQTSAKFSVRAAARVAVDWQVQVAPGADAAAVQAAVGRLPDLAGSRTVLYARVPGLRSTAPGGTRTTGAAYLVGLPADYLAFAPAVLRPLVGTPNGVALQQQTAANLAAGPGSAVEVLGSSGVAGRLTVGGVVDLRSADSFFQVVGAPAGGGASAPPDNVLLVPAAELTRLATAAGVPVVQQVHVRFLHDRLPADPATAAAVDTGRAGNLAVSLAGAGLVADNLGAALSAAREDAIYARLLVLLLGVPGVVLAGLVTALVIALRSDRQRRDIGLLRLRGATPARTLVLLGLPALVDGVLGSAAGVGLALLSDRLALGPAAGLTVTWTVAAVGGGLLLALVTQLLPALRHLRSGGATVSREIAAAPPRRAPWPLRLGLDLILLASSGLVFLLTARGGYKVVVVPEGLPVAAVDHAALLAPALAWPGLALLCWRLASYAMGRRRRPTEQDPRGRMADVHAAALRRRRWLVARGATGLAVALAVGVSTAVFTATYDRQARVDVALTVGSDVAVTLPPDTTAGSVGGTLLSGVPNVGNVEPMLHRLVYVGPDLQDLYGVDARTISRAAPLQDAFFPGSSAASALSRLAARPDAALVSQETLHDYQLHVGDTIRLRLRDATGTYRPVPFTVAGVVTEFATAPRDSFVVANRSYVSRASGSDSVQTLLIRTAHPGAVAAALRPRLPAPAVVTDISSGSADVTSASGLAATDLSGLARLSLGFGVLLALASGVLVLVVGGVQRRRSLVVLALLGATPRQRAGFLRSETAALVVAGTVGGLVIGGVVAVQLVKVLTGIFDPPPEHAAVPWQFLAVLVSVTVAAMAATTLVTGRVLGRVDASALRDV